MTTLVSAPTRLGAWLQATEQLLQTKNEFNLILSISSPASDGPVSRLATKRVDAFYASEDNPPLHTVAETIFPGWEYRHRGLHGMFDTYAEEYAVLKKGDPARWGTYASRLMRRRTSTGDTVNPLNLLIEKMRSELNARGTKKACYELGIAESEYDVPLYNTVDDQARRRGLPCLSHLSFKLHERRILLTAIYRSHEYRFKALGNLLGLARLQACVAKEVGAEIGTLVVHSTYAWVETNGGKAPLEKLTAELRDLLAAKEKEHELADGIR